MGGGGMFFHSKENTDESTGNSAWNRPGKSTEGTSSSASFLLLFLADLREDSGGRSPSRGAAREGREVRPCGTKTR